ncbi:uncharacterized protein LOC132197668 [Neocloeon triangulifer]|uniref:uncharacterized protein LOC132197668 n=1 Tax=Neocloeon triangulifer TaxID=2078957 RepID=UPI00286F89F7|nr:uncharacterized protein LOC132197668 [Neocloeon triangulifer]
MKASNRTRFYQKWTDLFFTLVGICSLLDSGERLFIFEPVLAGLNGLLTAETSNSFRMQEVIIQHCTTMHFVYVPEPEGPKLIGYEYKGHFRHPEFLLFALLISGLWTILWSLTRHRCYRWLSNAIKPSHCRSLFERAPLAIKMSHKEWYQKIEEYMTEEDEEALEREGKTLFDHIRDKSVVARYPIFLLCRLELLRGTTKNLKYLLNLAKLRCKDEYVLYIIKIFNDKWTPEEAKKKLLNLFENPEKNIKLKSDKEEPDEEVKNNMRHTHALVDASSAFKAENFPRCLELFAEAMDIAKKLKKTNDAKLDSSIKFLSALSNTHIGSLTSLTNALETLKSLIGTKTLKEETDVMNAGQGDKIPMAFYALGLVMEKLYRFKLGLKVLERGLEIVARKSSSMPLFYWPGSREAMQFCDANFLADEMNKLKQVFTYHQKPDAICRYDGCLEHQIIPCKDIYISEPEFNGYVVLTCENYCQIAYHLACWKSFKDDQAASPKISDKDILGTKCPTDDCCKLVHGKKVPNKIVLIVPYDHNGKEITKLEMKIETSPEPEPAAPAASAPHPAKKRLKKQRLNSGSDPQGTASSTPTTSNKENEKPSKGAKSTSSGTPAKAAEQKRHPTTSVKASPAKVNRGNAHLVKTASTEQDESTLANEIVIEKIPLIRNLVRDVPTLLEAVCTETKLDTSPYSKHLWYLFINDTLKNSGGIMNKNALFDIVKADTNICNDFKNNCFTSEDHKGGISKTEFYKYVLSLQAFGSVDDQICLVEKMFDALDYNSNEYQELYKKLYNVQFVPAPVKARRVILPAEQQPLLCNPESDKSTPPPEDLNEKAATSPDKVEETPQKDEAAAPETKSQALGEAAVFFAEEFIKSAGKAEVFVPVTDVEETAVNGLTLPEPTNECALKEDVAGSDIKENGVTETSPCLEPSPAVCQKMLEIDEYVSKHEYDKMKAECVEASKRIKDLEKLLSSEAAQSSNREKTFEKLSKDFHELTVEHKSLTKKSHDTERMLSEHLELARKEKDAANKKVTDLTKQVEELKKEKKKLNDNSDKGKKKKQDEYLLSAMNSVIQLMERQWVTVNEQVMVSKQEAEDLIYCMLDVLDENSKPTYEDAMKCINDWETLAVNFEMSGTTMKNRIVALGDISKNPEGVWPNLSKIDIPKKPTMPKKIVLEAVKEVLKDFNKKLRAPPQEPPKTAETQTDIREEAFPFRTPPPFSASMFQYQVQPNPGMFEGAVGFDRNHPFQSMQSAHPSSRQPSMQNFSVPPPEIAGYSGTQGSVESLQPAVASRPLLPPCFNKMYQSDASTSNGLPGFFSNSSINQAPLVTRYPQVDRDCPSPTSSTTSDSSVTSNEVASPASVASRVPTRDLIPKSLLHHVNRIKKNENYADKFKQPEPPKIQPCNATKLPAHELKFDLSFTEMEMKLIELQALIPYTSINDFRQVLHWLGQRRTDLRDLTGQKLKEEACNILTELLLNASSNELNEKMTDVPGLIDLPNDECCSICYVNYKECSNPIHTLVCGHFFHKTCIRTWLETKRVDSKNGGGKGCPICRGEVQVTSPNAEFPPLGHGRR